MLNNVAIQMNRAVRQRTLRDPSSIPCVLFKKVVTRASDGSTFDGAPTIGPLGVMSDEDEAAYDWEEVGDGMLLFGQGYAPSPGNTSDDSSRLDYAQGLIEAFIEPLIGPGEEGYVQPAKRMLVAVLLGDGIIVNYELNDVTGSMNIPPYTRKYVLEWRPDEAESEDIGE